MVCPHSHGGAGHPQGGAPQEPRPDTEAQRLLGDALLGWLHVGAATCQPSSQAPGAPHST